MISAEIKTVAERKDRKGKKCQGDGIKEGLVTTMVCRAQALTFISLPSEAAKSTDQLHSYFFQTGRCC
jgi:hypothetical protein